MDYLITLHDQSLITIEARAAMLDTYRALLEQELGGAEGVIAVYRALQDVMLLCRE